MENISALMACWREECMHTCIVIYFVIGRSSPNVCIGELKQKIRKFRDGISLATQIEPSSNDY
jgi:hypothetical protein